MLLWPSLNISSHSYPFGQCRGMFLFTYFAATTIVTERCRTSSYLLPLCRHRMNCFGRHMLFFQETGSYAEFSRLLQHTADGNVFKKVSIQYLSSSYLAVS